MAKDKDKLIIKYKGEDIRTRFFEFLVGLKPHEVLEFVMDGKKYHIKQADNK